MNFKWLVIHFLLMCVKANITNDIILDYFYYKKVLTVVGNSCNSKADDISLMKRFNENGVTLALNAWANVNGELFAANSKYYKIGVFLDTRCYSPQDIMSLIFTAADYRMYDELHCWLILANNLSDILKVVDNDAFGLSTDFIVAVSSDMGNYQLYDVYKKFEVELNVTLYGRWNGENGFDLRSTQSKFKGRSNFNGVALKAIFLQSAYKPKHMSSVEYYKSTENITKDTRIKFGYNIVIHLAEMYNFTIVFVESEKWKPGDVIGPFVRAFLNSKVDLTGTSTNMNSERISLMTFLHQGWPFRTCFIFRNPQPETIKIGEILRPFDNSVWYLMGLVSFTSVIILSLTLKWKYEGQYVIRISNCFTLTVGAICQQCTDIEVKSYSTRIVVFFIMIHSLIMYNYYSASVVSARLNEPIYKINDSLIELTKLNLKIVSERMTYLSFFFAVPFWEIQAFYKNFWLKVPESKRFVEPEIGMQLVQRGGFAYHVHPDVGYALIEKTYDNREICELMEVHLGYPTNTMFGVTKNSTFKEILKVGFMKISEVGIRHRQLKKWQYRKPCCRKDMLSASSVNIYGFAPHLILLVIGALLSIFIFIVEVIISKWILEV